ncbi:nuclear transport factor 2 family protein [bacterium]|nr:nuclear transport factor 2 family protein [bacterium]
MDDLKAHLIDQYEAWFASITSEGIGELDEVLADEWMYTNYDGWVRGKAEYLAWVAEQGPGPMFVGPYDVTLTRPGGLALVLGEYRVERLPDGSVLRLRFTGLWEERDGRWQSLTHHNTLVV